MEDFFRELFLYGHHCNQQLADVFAANPDKATEKSASLYSHILNAHQIWNNRIDPAEPPFGVWSLHPVRVFKETDKRNYERSLLLLDKFDLDDSVRYVNTKRQPFTNSVRDILFHIINHSTYHRGQIAVEFRKSGLEPLVTDYIWYKR